MSFFIICPGCKHTLTLPHDFVGKQARCPKCQIEFAAHPSATPTMDLETPSPIAETAADKPALNQSNPAPVDLPVQTAYTTTPGQVPSVPGLYGSIYCVKCGTKVADTEDACPACGFALKEMLHERPREQRRPLLRKVQPVRGFLPVVGAILIPIGAVVFLGGPIVSEGFRRPGSPPFVIGILFCILAGLPELSAIACFLTWLYQAWRAVLHGDEDYSPGLMVGLLFVPFFNFYWVFRAVPGLSLAIHQEMKHLAPNRTHATGFGPGLAACVLALFPPFWPIALCMFLAWVLIANDAVRRLVRWCDEGDDRKQ
ncbi:MAG: hypothetical protein EXR98_01385 [Gemmataceae bacterium]|nr:hypothetical protein [Gemmataceae bacterium]